MNQSTNKGQEVNPELVQLAKDFIWEYMDESNRELIIDMATLKTHERHGLYLRKIFAELEGKSENGIIIHERMIIGLQYNPPQSLV